MHTVFYFLITEDTNESAVELKALRSMKYALEVLIMEVDKMQPGEICIYCLLQQI